MTIVGWRKLVSAVTGITGIVLVTMFGVPQSQVDTLQHLLLGVVPQIVAMVGILGAVWKHLTTQGQIDAVAAHKHSLE